jgi:hypothetical protein
MIPSLFDDAIQKTVEHSILKAKYPERLTFALSLQGVNNISFDKIKNEKRIIVLDKNVVYGIGKTRYQLQKLYNNEDYILSIDCHTGFAQDWDEKLINEYEKIGNKKAVISQFLTDRLTLNAKKSKYIFSERGGWGIQYIYSQETENIKERYLSQRACPHFIFASKEFMKIDYPYMYFWGDEDHILSIKLFCNGFDIYELQQTYLTTVPKNKKECEERMAWFLSAISKHDAYQKYTDSTELITSNISTIKYDHTDTVLSSHLLYEETKKVINKLSEASKLIENEFNDILKEDFRNTERSIKQYFDFHGITDEQLLASIDNSRQWDV